MSRRRAFLVQSSKTYLYNAGDECTALTGGWINGYTEGTFTTTKQAAYIYLKTNSAPAYATVVPNNLIPMSGYKKLYAEYNCLTAGKNGPAALSLLSSKTNHPLLTYVALTSVSDPPTGTAIISINLTSFQGNYYVNFCDKSDALQEINLKSLWLEK